MAGSAEEVLKEKASLQIGAQFCREAGRKDHEAMPLVQVTVGVEVSLGGDSLRRSSEGAKVPLTVSQLPFPRGI